ncbi:hypothetical protein L593_13810 [Salinarchaeum sp. Harcht-Bsk1]|uniref:hypothetical protein n=1 Tax=Salinarchaeum sp. Harcht-Bsk1 TaxID=1333523 RepID=UPI000342429C|nr:hypothetical protein [Salinarchaeum sp. Harcht-Bsk1]AGN02701.1 hypothetical protein L593_13810 [Salinarchaeum sp. Harcht-Bsk1]
MSLEVGDAVSEAFDRITTQAALVLIGLYTITSVLQSAASQDVLREFVESIRDWGRDELTAEEYQELVDSTDPVLNDLPLALGLDLVPAIALWFVALVAGVAIVAVAIDAFAYGANTIDDLDTSRLLWRTLNILVGGLVFGILLFVGFAFLIIPGLIVFVLFVYFPVAVVVDDTNFVSALGNSLNTVTDNAGQTLLLIAVAIGVGIGIGIASSIVTFALPGTIAGIVNAAFSATSALFVLAILTRGYVAANAPEADEPVTGSEFSTE